MKSLFSIIINKTQIKNKNSNKIMIFRMVKYQKLSTNSAFSFFNER